MSRGMEGKLRECTMWNPLIPFRFKSKSRPVLDNKGRVFAVLAGKPNDATYDKATLSFAAQMSKEAAEIPHNAAEMQHKRGSFLAVNVGIFHGLGTRRPTNLDTGRHKDRVERILQDRNLSRFVGFADRE
jgi:hypothetical protein